MRTARHKRFAHICEGQVILPESWSHDEKIHFVIQDVSQQGLRTYMHEVRITIGQTYVLHIQLGIKKFVEVIARAVWTDYAHSVGWEIQNIDQTWLSLIARLTAADQQKKIAA